jgi:hypothetical protein
LSIAQNDSIELDEKVTGIIVSDEGTYLILNQGLIQIFKTDIYAEYYRQIYKDSTLVNPNTELKDDFSFTIIPYLAPSTFQDRIDFSEPINLGIFLQLNRSGEYQFTSFGESYIDSIRTK